MIDDGMPILALSLYLAIGSIMAVGGGVVMLTPDIHRYVVDVHHLITSEQFSAAYTMAQAAPGPNLLFVTLIGWQIGGLGGALLTTFAVIGPSSVLNLYIMRLTAGRSGSRLGIAFRRGFVPLSIGLLIAAAWVLAIASGVDWKGGILALLTILVVLRTNLNPLILIAIGAAAGLLGVV